MDVGKAALVASVRTIPYRYDDLSANLAESDTPCCGGGPGAFLTTAALISAPPADGAGGVQIAGAQTRAVRGHVRQHLGGCPVHRSERRRRYDRPVEFYGELEVECITASFVVQV